MYFSVVTGHFPDLAQKKTCSSSISSACGYSSISLKASGLTLRPTRLKHGPVGNSENDEFDHAVLRRKQRREGDNLQAQTYKRSKGPDKILPSEIPEEKKLG